MKKISRREFMAVTAVAAAATLSACGNSASSAANAPAAAGSTAAQATAPEVTLIGAHVNSDDSSFNIGMEAFAEKLKEISGGKMVCEVHGNGELGGDETELVQKMATGTVDAIATSPSFLASSCAKMDLFSMPFLYENVEHWKSVVSGNVGETMAQELRDSSDFMILAYWMCGIRSIFSTKEIHKLADLKGVKIRVASSENVQSIWAALGSQPTSLAYNELYSGLQNKVIDAAENDLGNILLQKFYEAGPNIALTQHDYATRFLVISKSKYENLNAEQQAWVDQAAEESREDQWAYDLELSDSALEQIKANGANIIEVEDMDQWAATVQPVMAQITEKLGVAELYQEMVDLRS